MLRVVSFVVVAMIATVAVHAQEADITSMFRELLEASLRERAGIGFESFSCDVSAPLGPGDRFHCSAVDEEGDQLRYTIEVDDEGTATVVGGEQRASTLQPEHLQSLEAPCRAFMEAYDRRDWPGLFDRLHPGLQEVVGGAAGVGDLLVSIREFFGEVRSARPEWFAVRQVGGQELEYRLRCENGDAEARFRIGADDDGELRLLAFTVTALPGSAEQAELLRRMAPERLSPIIGAEVERVDAPFERLVRRGDVVEGTAWLVDGRELVVRIEQHGLRDDFELNDYRFAVLELQFLIERALRPQLSDLASVSCEQRVVPDGGQAGCVATLSSGEKSEFIVRRQGGDHRLFPAE
jgi:hypothetical protein